jgi:aminomethyltransferase
MKDEDYLAIRTGAGIADYSAMGKFWIRGSEAMESLDLLVAGNLKRLMENSIRWTAILDDAGRVVADVQIYNKFDCYLVTCSAEQREVVAALLAGLGARGDVEDVSDTLAAIGVEGPLAKDVPQSILGMDGSGLGLLRFAEVEMFGRSALLSRIGFTGEFGYLFFVESAHKTALVDRILEVCPKAQRCGLGVQRGLRLEVRSFTRDSHFVHGETALEAGLHWMIDFRKDEFRGRGAVMAEKAAGLRHRLVGFTLDGDAGTVLRPGTNISEDSEEIGYVAAATWSPVLERIVGLAYLRGDHACVGLRLDVADGQLLTVSTPFISTESLKATAR